MINDLARAPGPGRGAQTERGLVRRNLILKAAARLFAEKGYGRVSINDIGLAAGVSGPAVYRYFPGKEDILISIHQHLYQRARYGADAIKSAASPPLEALARMVDFQIELAMTESEKIRIVDREERQLPADAAKALRRERRMSLSYWIDLAAQVRTDLSSEEVAVTVHGVLALINSITLRRASERADQAMVQRVRDMAMSCF